MLAALCVATLSVAAHAQLPAPAHVKALLAAQTTGAAPGSTIYVAVIQRIDKGWHTYWRNPGDAGEPTRITWRLPPGWRAGDVVWPAPERLPVGPLMNFGYERQVVLATPIEAPASAVVGSVAHIAAKVSMLVCADVCVPQEADLALDVPVVSSPSLDPVWGGPITRTLASAPKPSGIAATFQLRGDRLMLAAAGPALAGRSGAGAYFFPYDSGLVDQAQPQTDRAGPSGVTISAAAGPSLRQASPPGVIRGVLSTGDGSAFEVAATLGAPPAGAGDAAPAMSLALAAGGAFLGGLILNLMPCVFPILSMKAASLIARPHDGSSARRQGIAFLAGVLGTFLVLAGGIMALRAGGQAVGWGAQLQPPMVTAALALVLLAAALDLSGVYEIGASLQGLGAGVAAHANLVGAFFTGALAVVVAAPCTAPFMGPALGWALTQPPAEALAVFATLGLGFATPFTALAFSPGLARLLPRPGPWMDVLRRALAFPLYGAAAWLLWVLAAQTDRGTLATMLAAAILLAIGASIFGGAQRRAALGRPAAAFFALAGLAGVLSVGALAAAPFAAPPQSGGPIVEVAKDVPAEPWSPERVAALRSQGKPVFVDFTAAWCVTCQFNEQTALRTPEATGAFRRTGAVYLKADWTNRDDQIAKALADEGRVGVPLYLVYAPGDAPPKVLPQLLTSGLVAQALDAAASSRNPAGAVRPQALAAR